MSGTGLLIADWRPTASSAVLILIMTTKHQVPCVNSKFASFDLCIKRSRIERFGVFTKETIPRGKKVIQYTGKRINEREAVRRAVRMFLAGKAGRASRPD